MTRNATRSAGWPVSLAFIARRDLAEACFCTSIGIGDWRWVVYCYFCLRSRQLFHVKQPTPCPVRRCYIRSPTLSRRCIPMKAARTQQGAPTFEPSKGHFSSRSTFGCAPSRRDSFSMPPSSRLSSLPKERSLVLVRSLTPASGDVPEPLARVAALMSAFRGTWCSLRWLGRRCLARPANARPQGRRHRSLRERPARDAALVRWLGAVGPRRR